MAPNLLESTTTCSYDTYTLTTSASGENYIYYSITSRYEDEIKIKKLLKKMKDEMCKEGWIHHMTFYHVMQPKSISLRGVRLDGRGWANKLN